MNIIRSILLTLIDCRFETSYDSITQALYYPTHIRGSVFIIGMVLGVYFDELKDWLKENTVSWLKSGVAITSKILNSVIDLPRRHE